MRVIRALQTQNTLTDRPTDTSQQEAAHDEDGISSPPLPTSLPTAPAQWTKVTLHTRVHCTFYWHITSGKKITQEFPHSSSSAWSRKGPACKTVWTTTFLFTRPQFSISHFPEMSFVSASRKHWALHPQKSLRLIRDREVGGGGEVRNFISNTNLLHCQHQNDSALRWAAVSYTHLTLPTIRRV